MGFISHFLVFLPTWWLSLQTPCVAFEFEFINRAALNPHIPRCSVVDNAASESWSLGDVVVQQVKCKRGTSLDILYYLYIFIYISERNLSSFFGIQLLLRHVYPALIGRQLRKTSRLCRSPASSSAAPGASPAVCKIPVNVRGGPKY